MRNARGDETQNKNCVLAKASYVLDFAITQVVVKQVVSDLLCFQEKLELLKNKTLAVPESDTGR